MKRASKRITKERVHKICGILNQTYSTEYKCYLNYETPWQLLFATILSAQCTDERVNQVTEKLFVKYPDAGSLCTCGFERDGTGYLFHRFL